MPLAEPVQHIAPEARFEITLHCYGDTTNSVAKLVEDCGYRYGEEQKVIEAYDDTESLASKRYEVTGKIRIE